jgi:hypothetical protein
VKTPVKDLGETPGASAPAPAQLCETSFLTFKVNNMKRIFEGLCPALLLVLISHAVQAQPITKKNKADVPIDLNFLDNKSVYYWKLQYGTPYRVRLTNINRLVYGSTTAEQTGENLFTTVPGAFSAIKLPGFTSKNVPFPGQPGAGLDTTCPCSTASDYIKCNAVLNTNYNAYTNFLKQIEAAVEAFNTSVLLSEQLKALNENVTDTWDSIRAKKIRYAFLATRLTLSPEDPSASIRGFYRAQIESARALVKKADSTLKLVVQALDKKQSECFWRDSIRLSKQLACLECKNLADYLKWTDSLNLVKAKMHSYAALKGDLTGDLEEAKATLKELQGVDKEGKLTALQKLYDLLSEENFTLSVESFEAVKDLHTVKFTAAAENPLPFNRPQKRTIILNGITEGGWKVDFSAGAFASFGTETFLEPQYYYVAVSDTTKQIRQATGSRSAMLSVGALMHFYPRLYSFVKPALSVGVSTTTGFDNLNLHGGLSLLFGKPGGRNRVVVSGGITLRQVNLLDARYQLNTTYEGLPDTVPVKSFFPKSGAFLALTYNFATASK